MKSLDIVELLHATQLPFIVFSHLRWDFVWQRPQQILSRLAATHPVLFIEEPHFGQVSLSRLDISYPCESVVRIVPHLHERLRHKYDVSMQMVCSLLQLELQHNSELARQFREPAIWFYTPMPSPLVLEEFDPVGVVYDCMDELAQFKSAPSDIRFREKFLMSKADIVFTGGRKLYEAKSELHPCVHYFGCGVDIDHFRKAQSHETVIPEDIINLSRPIVGYYGVIDERLDYELIACLSQSKPDWNIVMVGPVVKVSPEDLPRAPNIHWLGQRDYQTLPNYVKGFDVCMMPFALNEATEYINPTKTLEYMAARKPIISSAVADVVKNFAPIVRIAHSHDDFIRQIDTLLRNPEDGELDAGLEMARNSTWDYIVAQIEKLITDAILVRATSQNNSFFINQSAYGKAQHG